MAIWANELAKSQTKTSIGKGNGKGSGLVTEAAVVVSGSTGQEKEEEDFAVLLELGLRLVEALDKAIDNTSNTKLDVNTGAKSLNWCVCDIVRLAKTLGKGCSAVERVRIEQKQLHYQQEQQTVVQQGKILEALNKIQLHRPSNTEQNLEGAAVSEVADTERKILGVLDVVKRKFKEHKVSIVKLVDASASTHPFSSVVL